MPLMVIGHRGACGYEPENTLASFKKALNLGVDMIELDVHALKTGELVVIHDDKLERTTNGRGSIYDLTLDKLRKLDAGKGQYVPTLKEIIEFVNRRVPINIELKGPGTAKGVSRVIDKYLSLGWDRDHFFVSSFNHVELDKFRSLKPDIKIGTVIYGTPLDYAAFASKIKSYSINISLEFISREFVRDAKKRGLKVFVFTVNDQDDAKKVLDLKVDGVFSDYPDKARLYLGA